MQNDRLITQFITSLDNKGLDSSLLKSDEYDDMQKHVLYRALVREVSLENIANPDLSGTDMEDILESELKMTKDLQVNHNIDPKDYSLKQLYELDDALRKGLNIHYYRNPDFSADQMYIAKTFQIEGIYGLDQITPGMSTKELVEFKQKQRENTNHQFYDYNNPENNMHPDPDIEDNYGNQTPEFAESNEPNLSNTKSHLVLNLESQPSVRGYRDISDMLGRDSYDLDADAKFVAVAKDNYGNRYKVEWNDVYVDETDMEFSPYADWNKFSVIDKGLLLTGAVEIHGLHTQDIMNHPSVERLENLYRERDWIIEDTGILTDEFGNFVGAYKDLCEEIEDEIKHPTPLKNEDLRKLELKGLNMEKQIPTYRSYEDLSMLVARNMEDREKFLPTIDRSIERMEKRVEKLPEHEREESNEALLVSSYKEQRNIIVDRLNKDSKVLNEIFENSRKNLSSAIIDEAKTPVIMKMISRQLLTDDLEL